MSEVMSHLPLMARIDAWVNRRLRETMAWSPESTHRSVPS